jgi:hypothetical protein
VFLPLLVGMLRREWNWISIPSQPFHLFLLNPPNREMMEYSLKIYFNPIHSISFLYLSKKKKKFHSFTPPKRSVNDVELNGNPLQIIFLVCCMIGWALGYMHRLILGIY